eukprot:573020-Prymnesium_polylepis.2
MAGEGDGAANGRASDGPIVGGWGLRRRAARDRSTHKLRQVFIHSRAVPFTHTHTHTHHEHAHAA